MFSNGGGGGGGGVGVGGGGWGGYGGVCFVIVSPYRISLYVRSPNRRQSN